MRGYHRYFSSDSLPETVPVFPLTGALLLPHGMIPLNIFEPRYLNLIEDALGNGRLIAMIQPQDTSQETCADDAPLYTVGCLGRITSFTETDDGHFQVILTGICRFRVKGEQPLQNSYRVMDVDYTPFLNDLAEEVESIADREFLLSSLEHYFEHGHINIEGAGLEDMDDHTLVNTMSMVCPFDPREKQALLECTGLIERARLLQTLMEMEAHNDEGSSNPNHH